MTWKRKEHLNDFPYDCRDGFLKKTQINRTNFLPEEYQWSSAVAHMSGRDDALVKVLPLLDMVGNWRDFLSENVEEHEMTKIRRHENTGRPLGSDNFINNLEKTLNCILRRQKPGPKCKVNKR
jgi:putative transposase